jgi:Arc/MetJ family transcription regulator
MRTNIDINDELLEKARALSKTRSKKEIVHLALVNYIKQLQRKKMLSLRGKVKWEGDLKKMRQS